MNQLGGNMAGHLMEDARFSEPLPVSTQVLYPGVNGLVPSPACRWLGMLLQTTQEHGTNLRDHATGQAGLEVGLPPAFRDAGPVLVLIPRLPSPAVRRMVRRMVRRGGP